MSGQSKDDLKKRIVADYQYLRDQKKADRFEQIRRKAMELANLTIDVVPLGRELSNSLTKIEEACMHASAGIARYPSEPDQEALP